MVRFSLLALSGLLVLPSSAARDLSKEVAADEGERFPWPPSAATPRAYVRLGRNRDGTRNKPVYSVASRI